MHRSMKISFATLAISLFATSTASACYKHTFDKCDASIQVSEATTPNTPAQSAKTRSSTNSQGSSGWVTTVTVNR